jgi:hypothetical protein
MCPPGRGCTIARVVVALALVLSAAFGAGDQYLGSLSTIAEVAAGLALGAAVLARRHREE